jgi:hypothetical protein
VLNAQVKWRRSPRAGGINTDHENAEGMACVGVRSTDQLGITYIKVIHSLVENRDPSLVFSLQARH